MIIKKENGFTGIDIAISIIVITIFISIIGNLIFNINLNNTGIERKSIATSYVIQKIENIKAQGYIDDYDNKGIEQKEIISEYDILNDDDEFTGYHMKVIIEDYVLIKNDNTKISDLVKKITVQVSYKLGSKNQNVEITTYITKE